MSSLMFALWKQKKMRIGYGHFWCGSCIVTLTYFYENDAVVLLGLLQAIMNSTTTLTCCICLSEYATSESPFELSCGHCVHAGCMLRLCLNRGEEARCPYCRAQVHIQTSHSMNIPTEEESTNVPTEDESVDSSSDGSEVEEMPQWQRLAFGRHTTMHMLRIRKQVMKKLFQKGRNKGAPLLLKRCSEEQKRLTDALLAATREVAKYKTSGSRKPVREALFGLKEREAAVEKAARRISVHSRKALMRCVGNRSVRDYLRQHPLVEVT